MRKPLQRLVFWTPRILCLLFAAFLTVFALDVLDEGLGFWKTLLALLIHLTPTWIILIVLAVSWRWEWAGAVLFTLLGGLYLVLFWGRFRGSGYPGPSGPLFLVGVLFLLSRTLNGPRRKHASDAPDGQRTGP